MLVLFVVGVMNLLWIVLLTAFMLLWEKPYRVDYGSVVRAAAGGDSVSEDLMNA